MYKRFLAHSPSTETLVPNIDDGAYGDEDDEDGNVSAEDEGSFQVLVEGLELKSSLTELRIHPGLDDFTFLGGCIWQDYVLPSDGFSKFKALETLAVPFASLFNPSDADSLHITPASSLPLKILRSMLLP
jgi:hypothetical protein